MEQVYHEHENKETMKITSRSEILKIICKAVICCFQKDAMRKI